MAYLPALTARPLIKSKVEILAAQQKRHRPRVLVHGGQHNEKRRNDFFTQAILCLLDYYYDRNTLNAGSCISNVGDSYLWLQSYTT